MDGIIVVNKAKGFTSFDVVAKLRGILKQKKIGHTGTLDPLAEGVLIVCLGKATKLVEMLTSDDKCYQTRMLLGKTTDTEDITGNVLSICENLDDITDDKILSAINKYIGEYDQIPPMYSAIKVNGKKLYEYARNGIEIERKPRRVNIFSIDDIHIEKPYVTFNVHCSKGTYIRSLCRDIGETLSCGATMDSLLRSEVHGQTLEDAYTLEQIEKLMKDGSLEAHILKMDVVLSNYEECHIKSDQDKYLFNGNKLTRDAFEETLSLDDNQILRVYSNNELMALYRYDKNDDILRPYKMLLS